MHEKGLKKFMLSWKDVRKQGGNFLLALNGFPVNKTATPTLVVDAKKKLEREALKRVADEPQLDKLVSGRIVVEDGRFAFVIDADSTVKSPSVLKQAIRQLAKKDELSEVLKKAAQGTFRMDEGLDLDGEAELDTKAQAVESGGKASLKARIVGSDWTKILSGLDDWNKKFAGRLDGGTVARAEEHLAKLEGRVSSWLRKHADDAAKGDRKREVERVQQALTAARARITRYRDAVRNSTAADDLLDALAANKAPTDPLVLGPQLRAAEDNLGARLARTEDPDEQAQLKAQLTTLRRAITTNLGDRGQELTARQKTKPKDLDDTNQRITDGLQLGREVTAQTEQVLQALRSGDVLSTEGPKEATALFRAIDALGEAGGRKTARELRQQVLDGSTDIIIEGYIEQALKLKTPGERHAWLGQLGRGNTNDIALRARAIGSFGKPYFTSLVDRLDTSLGDRGKRKFGKPDNDDGSPLAVRYKEAEVELNARTQATNRARQALYASVKERLRPLGGEGDAERVIDALLLAPGTGDPLPAIPSVDAAVASWLSANPGKIEAYVDEAVSKVLTFVRKEQVMDVDGNATREALTELAKARIDDGQPIDVASLLRAFPRPSQWSSGVDLDGLEARVVESGALSPEDAEANRVSSTHYDEAKRIADTSLRDKVEAMKQGDKDVFDVIVKGFKDIVDPMIAAPEQVPAPIRASLLEVYDRLSIIPEVGEDAGLGLASDALFLRWLAQFGVVPGKPCATMISGLFMNCANGTEPHSLEAMPFVPLVREYTPKFAEFVRAVLEVARGDVAEPQVEVSDKVTRTVKDPITKKSVTGTVSSEHPERPRGWTPDTVERNAMQRQQQKLMDAMNDPTPETIWPTFFRQQAQAMIGNLARGVSDEMTLLKGARNDFIAKVRDHFFGQCEQLDAPLVMVNGRMPAVEASLQQLRELIQADIEKVREGERAELFVHVDGEDDQLDVDEHWESIIFPRFVGLLNNMLQTGEGRNVRPINVLALSGTVLLNTRELHRTNFDPARDQHLPTHLNKASVPIQQVFTRGTQDLEEAVQGVIRTKVSTAVFAWDPIGS